MLRLSRGSLGLKLNLALIFFFLMLGSLTTVLLLYGFNRTQDDAKARSQEGLEELGELALLGVIAGQAEYGALALEAAAEMGFRASQYLANFDRTGVDVEVDPSTLAKSPEGVIYDPDPDRITDLVAPNYVELTDAVLHEVAFSARLNAIVPALMTDFPDSLREENFDPIAFVFIGTNSTVRYFPPVRIWEDVPPDIDVTTVKDRLGPEGNPAREMFWRAPYEDAAGKGLVMTVEVPVYSGDEYKGAFQIDLSLDKLVAQIDLLKLTSVGFAFYVDSRGDVIQGEAQGVIASEIAAGNAELSTILDAMRRGEEDVGRATIDGSEMFIGYSPVEGVGGSLGLAASIEEITASAAAITAGIEDEGERTLQVTLLAMGALFAAGLIGATYLNRRVLVRPIEAMVAATRAVAQGDFDTRVPVKGNDELAALGDSFNRMTSDIQREVQEREAAQQELAALFAAMTDAVVVIDAEGRYLRVPPTNAPSILLPPEALAGKTMRDVMPDEQADTFMRSVRQALLDQATETIEFPLVIGERTYWFSAAVSPISHREVVVVTRDITERVNAAQELERQVDERTRELRLLLDVSQNVASTLDMRELAGTLLGQLWSVIGFDGAALMLLQGDGTRVFESPIGNEAAPGIVIDRLTAAPPGGTGSMAIERRAPVAVADTQNDPELAAWVAQIPGRATAGRSWLSAPLIAQGRVLGVLNFWSVTPGTFGEQHAELAMAVANQTAVAIENARLYQEASAMAAVEERQRLARELHDSVSQALYGIALGARTARTLLDTDPSRAIEPMDYVLQLAEAGLAEMRALIFELRPESLEAEGLVAALEKQIAATRARYGIEVEASLCDEPTLSLAEKEVFYRVAQESLHNIVKHAHASRVEVLLSDAGGTVHLEVRDNGAGFDATQSFPGHMGLVSINERAASIGARVSVESTPAVGTVVRLTLAR